MIDTNAITQRIAELRAKDDFVRNLQGFAESTADMLEALRDELEVLRDGATFGMFSAMRLYTDELGELRAMRDRLTAELAHATAHDGDHLSKASRRMVDTVMSERDALRMKVCELTAEVQRMRPVVEAAGVWHDLGDNIFLEANADNAVRVIDALSNAIDAYRASKEQT